MNIITPKRLRTGSRVAIVAPSGPIVTDEVLAGIDIIRECGLEPVLGPCVKVLKTTAAHAASVQDRANELNWAFQNTSVSCVIGAVGGEGSAAVLPYLDYDMIRASRKPFIGMSDLTAINTGILKKSGLISFNTQTPSIRLDKGAKIRAADSESFKLTLELLKSDQVWGSRPFEFNPHFPRVVSPGSCTGFSIGGNLDTFVHLIGTPYMPSPEGSVLFIEDVHKGGEEISRELLHLRLAGFLSRVAGVVIGEFEDVDKRTDPKVPSVEDVILEYFAAGPPCTYGYSFSHGPHTSPIPIGARVSVDADSGDVHFDFKMAT
jgi:muramoyltetrapeptide carboxypeptidase